MTYGNVLCGMAGAIGYHVAGCEGMGLVILGIVCFNVGMALDGVR